MRRRREELGLSLRDVADKTSFLLPLSHASKTAPASPTRTTSPDSPRGSTFRWNAFSAAGSSRPKSSQAVVYYPQEPVPEIVEAHLRADRNLTPETAAALSELFRVAYTQFSK